jgi:hypothetical protein
MNTQKTLEKIKNSKIDPYIQKKILEAKRYTTSQDFINDVTTKYPIPDSESISLEFMKQFTITQALMMVSGIFLTIDWNKKEYYVMDLQLGKEIRNEKKK